MRVSFEVSHSCPSSSKIFSLSPGSLRGGILTPALCTYSLPPIFVPLPAILLTSVRSIIVSIQRKALQPYTFSDGAYVPAGNLVCVPQAAIMLDPNNYTAAGTFDGFRFVKDDQNRTHKSDETDPKSAVKEQEARTKFTDVDWKFPFWGASKRAWYVFFRLFFPFVPAVFYLSWLTTHLSFSRFLLLFYHQLTASRSPARWYVSLSLKSTLAHLLLNYDFELEDPAAKRVFWWTTAIVPRNGVKLRLKKRARGEM